MCKDIQTAINQVAQWVAYHGLKLSPRKTMAMHSHKRGKFHPYLNLGANPLRFVHGVKYWVLNPVLSWVTIVESEDY